MKLRLVTTLLMAALSAPIAFAADLPSGQTSPAPVPAPVVEDFMPWMVRIRGLAFVPQSSANLYGAGAPIDGTLKVSNSIVPEIDISYFFTKNIAIEAICCVVPAKINAKGAVAALGNVGDVIAFPPTITLQYHFTDFGAFKPYIGVGVNYTHYFPNGNGANFANLKVDDSWGVAGQIGFDYMIDKHWAFNVDVKKILMQPNAQVNLLTPGGAVPLVAKTKIDPWLIGVGVGYRF
jgi:outer membrane protein